MLIKNLRPITILKQFRVLVDMGNILLPLSLVAVFGNSPGEGLYPGGGMQKICSSTSLAPMDSDNAIRNMSTGGGSDFLRTAIQITTQPYSQQFPLQCMPFQCPQIPTRQ